LLGVILPWACVAGQEYGDRDLSSPQHSTHSLPLYLPKKGKEDLSPKTRGGFFSTSLEGLYWEVRARGLACTFSDKDTLSKFQEAGGGKSPGWRLGVGYGGKGKPWRLSFNGIWMKHDHDSRMIRETLSSSPPMMYPCFQTLRPLIAIEVARGRTSPQDMSLSYARSHWIFNLQNYTLDGVYSYALSSRLSTSLLLGMHLARNRETLSLYYLDPVDHYSDLQLIRTLVGAGLRVGWSMSCQFAKRCELYGHCAFSTLRGHLLLRRKQEYDHGDGKVNATSSSNISRSHRALYPVLQLGIGCCVKFFKKGEWEHVRMRAGWEQQIWFRYHDWIRSNEPDLLRNSSLNLKGLIGSLQLIF